VSSVCMKNADATIHSMAFCGDSLVIWELEARGRGGAARRREG
jgi:hypothetical protein